MTALDADEESPAVDFAAGVDPRAQAVLRSIPASDLDRLAASASGVGDAVRRGKLRASEVEADHIDKRTIGIVRVRGVVATQAGEEQAWSAVAKVVDLNVANSFTWVRPEIEPAAYACGCFTGAETGFRQARCHLISNPAPQVTVLWLEDLGQASRAPFDLDQLARMLRHVGQWNGTHVGREIRLPFEPGRDRVALRWRETRHDVDLREFLAMRGSSALEAMYGSRPIELPLQLHEALVRANERAGRHAHTLCFGDCSVSNLFCTPSQTVAVDWASLSFEPLGVDAGAVIGSALTWGKSSIEAARNERALFDCYLAGLAETGWRGDRNDVRRGFMLHFGTYLLSLSTLPTSFKIHGRGLIERRMEGAWDDLPRRCAGLVDLLPGYIEELAGLA